MKERITLTIDKEILDKIDKVVDGLSVRNRSHAIELVLSKYLNFRELKTAIILCGGEGTRLRPITYEIPKPLVPVHGKPIIEHIFDLLKKYGVTDIILSVGHMKEKILKEVDGWSRLGLKIDHVAESKPMGTGGAIKIAREKLPKTFIVSNGDELKSLNILDMYEMHKKNKALATIALTTLEDPSAYGVARLDGNRIIEFVEKPKKGKAPSNLINAGFYILENKIIDMIPKGFCSLEKEIFPKLAEQGRLFGFPFSGQWFDTGNLQRYERALKEWRDIKPE
ncbi:MAG: NTP transferase domain-containing protein [Candidatus Aenigmarchaeota archaeon]|nr:NTP transferase domain-containing protein [Candidatus Aenigmarchaeota archaeon]NIQ18082.1 NTP transferase domain-containing protein [Candidatus Aenigmarchaeota archaeon]